MTGTEKYNGWTNYETWNVSLWLGNDEGTDGYWREVAQDAYDDATSDRTFTRVERATQTLAERMKRELDDDMHDAGVPKLTGFYADLLNAALSEVNWPEIAGHYVEAVADATPDDDQGADQGAE